MFANTKKDINFFDAYSLKEKNTNITLKTFISVLIVEVFLVAGISGFLYGVKKLKQYENIEMTKKVESLLPVEKVIGEIKYEGNMLNTKKNIKDEITKINDVTYKTLTIFEKVLTSDMAINNMNIDSQKLTCTIEGEKEESFAQLLHNLEKSNIFESVEIKSISSKDIEGKRRASINAKLIGSDK